MKKNPEIIGINDDITKNYLNRFYEYFSRHKIFILGFLFFFITISAGFSIYINLNENRENRSSLILSEILKKIDDDKKTGVSEKDIKNRHELLKEKYSGTHSARYSDIIIASYYYSIGKYSQSEKLYSEFLINFSNDFLFGSIASSGSGYSYMMLKDYKKAADIFSSACSSGKYLNKNEAYFNLGLLYMELKEDVKSREAFHKLLETDNDSMYRQIIIEKNHG